MFTLSVVCFTQKYVFLQCKICLSCVHTLHIIWFFLFIKEPRPVHLLATSANALGSHLAIKI
jgi:hypothetical protein